MLEGSVRKAGNRVRVTGQLIDAANGAHIWAERFDRDLTDIFAVQDELTKEIIAALKVKLTPEDKNRLARKGTIDVEVYNLFLRGREQHSYTREVATSSAQLLERAVTINSDFAAALAFIAFTHVNDYINGWADLAEHSLQTGLEIAQRAVQVDEEEPQAHFVVGVALLWSRKHDRALAELQRSVAIAPNFAEAHLAMAHVLIYSGDAAGAIDSLDTGMRLIPCIGISRFIFWLRREFR